MRPEINLDLQRGFEDTLTEPLGIGDVPHLRRLARPYLARQTQMERVADFVNSPIRGTDGLQRAAISQPLQVNIFGQAGRVGACGTSAGRYRLYG